MPRRSILAAAERESLFALPETHEEIIRHYTFSESDLSVLRQRLGHSNRLGNVLCDPFSEPTPFRTSSKMIQGHAFFSNADVETT
jgi:Domain of unknown function (DUF4158)